MINNSNSEQFRPIGGITPTPHQVDVLGGIDHFLTLNKYEEVHLPLLGYDVESLSEIKLRDILNMLNDKQEYLFATLQGRAGVGKTTVGQWIIDAAAKYYHGRVCVSYPTHKAGRVLRNKIKGKYEFSTLQALVGMSPNMHIEKFNPNNLKFYFKGKDELPMDKFQVIFLDEASMLGSALYNFFVDRCKSLNIKVVFTGHKAQLPGVNDYLSKAFSDVKNLFYLNEIIRQKDTNPNVGTLTQLEENILIEMAAIECIKHSPSKGIAFDQVKFELICKNEGINHKDIKYEGDPNVFFQNSWKQMLADKPTNINTETGEGYRCMDTATYEKTICDIFSTDAYEANRDILQVYNFTNKCAKRDNRLVKTARNKNRNLEGEGLMVGETIMSYANIKGKISDMLLANSEDFIITKIREVETHWHKKPTKGAQIKIGGETSPEYILVECPMGSKPDVILKAYACHVEPVFKSDEDERNFDDDYIMIAHPDSYKAIVDMFYTVFNNNGRGFKRGMKSFYGNWLDFKARNVLLNDLWYCPMLKDAPDGGVSDRKINENFRYVVSKDLDRGYSCTIHKSQGSTKVNVGVNLLDLESNEEYQLRKTPITMDARGIIERLKVTVYFKKLLYVAWSRTSKFTFICVK